MSLLQFLRILFARRAIVLAALISCFTVAVVISQLLPPRYEAKTRIILDIIKPDPVTGTLISTQFLRAYTRTQIELIEDYRTAGRVVDELGWASNPELVAQYAADSQGQGNDIRRWLAQRIIDGTEANLIEGSNILEITYTGPTAEGARQTVELVRSAYMDLALQSRREAAAARPTGIATRPKRRCACSPPPRPRGPNTPRRTASSCSRTTPISRARSSRRCRAPARCR